MMLREKSGIINFAGFGPVPTFGLCVAASRRACYVRDLEIGGPYRRPSVVVEFVGLDSDWLSLGRRIPGPVEDLDGPRDCRNLRWFCLLCRA